jgi:hypothetical protein
MLGAVPRDQFSSRERRAPVALVARHQHDRARLVGERVVAPARTGRVARGGALVDPQGRPATTPR